MSADRDAGRGYSRREFLHLAAIAGVGMPLASVVFAACETNRGAGTTTTGAAPGTFGDGGITVAGADYPLARPHAPVTWNIFADNPAIKSGLAPETGTLKVLGYPDYIYEKVLKEFQARYSTKVEWFNFSTPGDMVANIQADPSAFDLICTVTLDNVGKLIAGGLVQPLNHSYLTNFENIWPSYQDPFYDRKDRYTIPYTVSTTGIAWRNDLVPDDLASMPNPYDIFWDTTYRQKVHVLNGSRDVMALGLVHDGERDVNTEVQSRLRAAGAKLVEGARIMDWKFDDSDYQQLTVTGEWLIHQTWSGQVAFYASYLPKGLPITSFSYLWPPQGAAKKPGLLQNDVFAIPKGASSPVLAHRLIDMLLEPTYALQNYGYEGYQPPLKFIEPDTIVAKGIVPPSLKNIIITEDMLTLGVPELELAPATAAEYKALYHKIIGAAGG
jgi:spermidine/putrescine transport system substrate-binding protein